METDFGKFTNLNEFWWGDQLEEYSPPSGLPAPKRLAVAQSLTSLASYIICVSGLIILYQWSAIKGPEWTELESFGAYEESEIGWSILCELNFPFSDEDA